MTFAAKVTTFKVAGAGALLFSLLLWMYGGAQIGFYKTYYEVEKFDEILEFTYTEKVSAFLPGIETLFLGFSAFVVLSVAGLFLEAKKKPAPLA